MSVVSTTRRRAAERPAAMVSEAAALRWADEALRCYQRQMGALEMPEWEQSVERRSARCYGGAPRKNTKPATGLIDLDLVRGSTFPKAKPQQGVWFAVRHGLLRAALLPLFRRWWCRHVGPQLFLLLLTAYLLYGLVLAIRFTADSMPSVTVAELLTPAFVASALSVIKSQIVACKETHLTAGGGKSPAAARLKRRRQSRTSTLGTHSSISGIYSISSESLGSHHAPEVPPAREPEHDLPSALAGTAVAPLLNGHLSDPATEPQGTGQTVSSEPTVVGNSTPGTAPSPGPARAPSGPSVVAGPIGKPVLSTRSASDDLVTSRLPLLHIPARSFSADSIPSPPARPTELPCSQPGSRRRSSRERRLAAGRRASRKLVRIADLPERVLCYHTDSTDSKSDDELVDLSPSSSTSALSKTAPASAGAEIELETAPADYGPLRAVTDSSAAEVSCSERRDSDGGGQHRSYVKTSGSDSEASYSSGASATSGQQEPSVTWDPLHAASAATDRTGCIIWEGAELKKVDLTTLDICSVIFTRVEAMPQSTDYLIFGVSMAALVSLLPTICRLGASSALVAPPWPALPLSLPELLNATARLPRHLAAVSDAAFGATGSERVVTIGCLLVTLLVTCLLFFVLSVVERSFKQRLLYAKYFCYLTSARRARKFELPHFRLKKVRNIKTWLSVRSCLKKRGPQRSVDTIVSAACITTVVLVTCLCVELLENTETPRVDYYRIQLVLWCFSLGVYLVRLMSLGSYINRKYRNLSVVLTEQINVYLQIEQKPHKKDRLVLANNVLKLASELLKELESPFTVLGFSANPFLYNATKLIVLSACSGVLSDMLGFKLKLYKIKLK